MYEIIAVTNRHLVEGDYLEQIRKIAKSGIQAIVLREKDITENEYKALAIELMKICEDTDTHCVLHKYVDVARKLGCERIHLPLEQFVENPDIIKEFKYIGISVHSAAEAKFAERLGASHLSCGHIFETECKEGVPPRGVDLLKEVCQAVNIPVYAIGGINFDNMKLAIDAGASGVCMMSEMMKYIKKI